MAQELPGGDVPPRFRQVGQVVSGGRVEVERAVLEELYHRHGGERLGDGAGGPHRVGGGKAALLFVGEPVAHHPGDVGRLDDGERQARDALLLHKAPNHLVHGPAQVRRVGAAAHLHGLMFACIHLVPAFLFCAGLPCGRNVLSVTILVTLTFFRIAGPKAFVKESAKKICGGRKCGPETASGPHFFII